MTDEQRLQEIKRKQRIRAKQRAKQLKNCSYLFASASSKNMPHYRKVEYFLIRNADNRKQWQKIKK